MGSGCGVSINNIISIIQDVLEKDVVVTYQDARKSDVPVSILDVSRYESIFGKLINVDLHEGIKRLVKYLNNI